ncbi:MAG: peptidyl-prolyl cis-trans isomerase [Pseudomonadota bacterium]
MVTFGWKAALVACALLAGAQAHAATPVAARINGEPLYRFTLDVMLHNAPRQQGRPNPAVLLDTLVAERLTAAWVRASYGAAQLYPATGVGFARDVALDDKLVGALRSLYGKELEAELRARPGGNLDSAIVEAYKVEPEKLERLFGVPGKLRLDYTLGTEREALAKQVKLIRFTLGKTAPVTLSMHDILRRQNVQGRMEFFSRNIDFMQQQARAAVATRFVIDWASRRFGAGPMADLRQALADQDDVRAAMGLYGIADGAEAESPIQAALMRQVSEADIKAWYASHKEEFRATERVKARHIRVADEATAREVAAAAARGDDFSALARRYSKAADAGRGGDLGWVVQTASPDWLAALALLQPEGQVSSPFREAVGAGQAASWEILLVDKRIEGYHAAASETVRYQARKAIAMARARSQFAAARAQALRSAVIDTAGAAP